MYFWQLVTQFGSIAVGTLQLAYIYMLECIYALDSATQLAVYKVSGCQIVSHSAAYQLLRC